MMYEKVKEVVKSLDRMKDYYNYGTTPHKILSSLVLLLKRAECGDGPGDEGLPLTMFECEFMDMFPCPKKGA